MIFTSDRTTIEADGRLMPGILAGLGEAGSRPSLRIRRSHSRRLGLESASPTRMPTGLVKWLDIWQIPRASERRYLADTHPRTGA